MSINTFIFDLGGVILDLDETATAKAFAKISNKSEAEIRQIYLSTTAFVDYEKGLITDNEFRTSLRSLLSIDLQDQIIDNAWNAMLGGLTIKRLNLLNELRRNHKVMILSNTNNIHIKAFNKTLKNVSGKSSLLHFADFVFFSHELNMRKPDQEIYRQILKMSNTNAKDALFMDDKWENLSGAESIGIDTMQIEYPDQILELEKYVR